MENNEVRALCAKITLETNPKNCDILIAELTRALTATQMPLSKVQSADQLKWAHLASQGTRKVG